MDPRKYFEALDWEIGGEPGSMEIVHRGTGTTIEIEAGAVKIRGCEGYWMPVQLLEAALELEKEMW